MPVGREGLEDGKPGRQYRGKANPLGVAVEWVCPSCRSKNQNRPFEQGCEHCGVGDPGTQPPPVAKDSSIEEGLLSPRQENPRPRQAEPGLSRGVTAPQVPGLVVTRILQYVCKPGMDADMLEGLQRALVGRYEFGWGSLTAAIVDEVSARQQDILSLANRQPGVWLARPPRNKTLTEIMARYSLPPEQFRRAVEETPMARVPPPDTGPVVSPHQAAAAQALVTILGYKGGYTLALALQNYAELAAVEAMEPEKIYTREECLALANALMQLIPEDWEPIEEPPPAPTLGDA